MIIKEEGSNWGVDQITLPSDDPFAFAASPHLGCLQEFSVLETYARQRRRLREREGERRGRVYLNTDETRLSIGHQPVC